LEIALQVHRLKVIIEKNCCKIILEIDKELWDQLPEEILQEYLELTEKLKELNQVEKCEQSFLDFVKSQWPQFIEGSHHRIMANAFERIADGRLKRLIINMPPRHTKSEFASHMFPAWLVGKRPGLKIIQATHTADLAVKFGRKVRDLFGTSSYQAIFPDVSLHPDSQAAGKWETRSKKNAKIQGEYYAAGVGGAIAGRGADLFIIDDPHSEQDAMSKTALDEAYEWYTSGPRQRLQPGGAIVIVMTRWSVRDLTGRLVRDMGKGLKNDQWEVIELPAILPSGDPVWPEYWSLDELEGVQAALGKGPKWYAQYMQKPTSEEGALIKREWWKTWEKSTPPTCEYLIQSYDTAFLKTQTSDYSAITTWGVFYPEGRIGEEMYNGDVAHLILLDSVKERLEFPELKRKALELYEHWEPDTVIIESKGSGTPLTQELRRIGVPVQNFTPSKGSDKVARVNSCTPLFESGMVWKPDQPWADEMVEECVSFPAGDHDDLVDSMSQAILRFRQGGFVQLASDYEDEYDSFRERKMVYY
tara:strand:- start:5497 stop:7089 length:1593 start_codon:yes stop_codon:yes gene_type:complete